jgi:hypothetical protein
LQTCLKKRSLDTLHQHSRPYICTGRFVRRGFVSIFEVLSAHALLLFLPPHSCPSFSCHNSWCRSTWLTAYIQFNKRTLVRFDFSLLHAHNISSETSSGEFIEAVNPNAFAAISTSVSSVRYSGMSGTMNKSPKLSS